MASSKKTYGVGAPPHRLNKAPRPPLPQVTHEHAAPPNPKAIFHGQLSERGVLPKEKK